jgi:hypothetical protein
VLKDEQQPSDDLEPGAAMHQRLRQLKQPMTL